MPSISQGEPLRSDKSASRDRDLQVVAVSPRGKSLVIVSSDLDELMTLCDAILAYANGRVVKRFEREAWTHEALMQAAFATGDAA